MKYNLVNKELRIFSCSVSDLTMQQVASFLEQWEHGAKIGELTLFYEKETDSLVINQDNKNYNKYLDIAESYLTLDDDELQEFSMNIPEGAKETVALLQRCRQRRKALQMLNILKYQYVKGCPGTEEYVVFKELKEKNKNEYTSPFYFIRCFQLWIYRGQTCGTCQEKKINI